MTIDAGTRPPPTADLEAPSRRGVDMRQLSGPDFDEAVAALDGVCQEQTFAFNRARYPNGRLEPMVVAADGQVIGATLVLIQKLPPGMGAVAVTKWGPAMRDGADSAAYGITIDALIEEYAD